MDAHVSDGQLHVDGIAVDLQLVEDLTVCRGAERHPVRVYSHMGSVDVRRQIAALADRGLAASRFAQGSPYRSNDDAWHATDRLVAAHQGALAALRGR